MKTRLMTLAVMCFIATATSFAQTSEKVHKIKNGETIESIAEKYGVTIDDIKNANPNAGGYFYIGMSINIPEKTEKTEKTETIIESETTTKENAVNAFFNNSTDFQSYRTEKETENEYQGWGPAFELGYGFLQGKAWAYKATFGCNYTFANNFYAGGQIGYNSSNLIDRIKTGKYSSISQEMKMHFITIPFEVGYKAVTNDRNWGFLPFAGLGFNIGLKGEYKLDKNKQNLKIGGKLGVEARIGLRIHLHEFQLTGSYHIPMNSKQEGFFGEDAYPELSIGFGI